MTTTYTVAPLTPIKLNDDTAVPVYRTVDPSFGSVDKTIHQWLDANFRFSGDSFSGRKLRRLVLSQQPTYFSFNNKHIALPVVDTSSIPWHMGSGPGTYRYKPVYAFTPIQVSPRSTAEKTYTQLPDIAFETLGSPIALTCSAIKSWTSEKATTCKQNRRGSAREELEYIFRSPYWVDKVGTFSFFGDDPEIKRSFRAAAPAKMKGLKIDKIFRGNTEAEIQVEEVTVDEVLNGKAFFLYTALMDSVDQQECAVTKNYFAGLGSFLDLEQISRFKKARQFLADLLALIQKAPIKVFNSKVHESYIKKYADKFTKYSDRITQILDFGSVKDPNPYDRVAEVFANREWLSEEVFQNLHNKTMATHSEIGRKKRNLEEAFAQIKTQRESKAQEINKLGINLRNSEQQVKNLQNEEKRLKLKILELERDYKYLTDQTIPNTQTSLRAGQEDYDALNKTVNEMNTNLMTAKEEYERLLQELKEKTTGTDFAERLALSNLVITEMIFKRGGTGQPLKVTEYPSIAATDDYSLTNITFLTIRPTKIYIDRQEHGEKAKAIAGGPYEVQISLTASGKPMMAIRLASLNSVFGFTPEGKAWRAKPHPHTDSTIIYPTIDSITKFAVDWKSCCLGEVETAMRLGMKNNDPKMILNAALSWLSSCNTFDQWGKDYTWFPPTEEVNLYDDQPITLPPPPPPPVNIDDVLNQIKRTLEQKQTTETGA